MLVAAGYSSLLLASFYLLVMSGISKMGPAVCLDRDEPDHHLYFHNLVDIGGIAQRFVGGDLSKLYLGQYGDLAVALVEVAITFGICRFLYARKIFLRL